MLKINEVISLHKQDENNYTLEALVLNTSNEVETKRIGYYSNFFGIKNKLEKLEEVSESELNNFSLICDKINAQLEIFKSLQYEQNTFLKMDVSNCNYLIEGKSGIFSVIKKSIDDEDSCVKYKSIGIFPTIEFSLKTILNLSIKDFLEQEVATNDILNYIDRLTNDILSCEIVYESNPSLTDVDITDEEELA